MAHSGISATNRPTKLERFWLLNGEPLIISDLGKCSVVKRCEPRSGRRDSQILIPNLTFDPQFCCDAGREFELHPLGPAVRGGHLEFYHKISPRHRAGDKFSVCESRR